MKSNFLKKFIMILSCLTFTSTFNLAFSEDIKTLSQQFEEEKAVGDPITPFDMDGDAGTYMGSTFNDNSNGDVQESFNRIDGPDINANNGYYNNSSCLRPNGLAPGPCGGNADRYAVDYRLGKWIETISRYIDDTLVPNADHANRDIESNASANIDQQIEIDAQQIEIGFNASTNVDQQNEINQQKDEIIHNTTDINTNNGKIEINTSNIAENKQEITTNSTSIKANTDNIESNTSHIAENKQEITTNSTSIQTNTDNIESNTSHIAENKQEITTNSTSIQTNTGNIADNKTSITQNKEDIQTNYGYIQANMDNINENAYQIELLNQNMNQGFGVLNNKIDQNTQAINQNSEDILKLRHTMAAFAALSGLNYVDGMHSMSASFGTAMDRVGFAIGIRLKFSGYDAYTAFQASSDLGGNQQAYSISATFGF